VISVLILTKDEERNLPGCLQSVSFSDDVLVFDSLSDDATVQLAQAAGARVLLRRFDNYGAQRQAALDQGNFKYPWLLVLDADERVDDALRDEIARITKSTEGARGYLVRRKDHFVDGTWIPRATLYPSWHLRMVQHRHVRYLERTVHERLALDGTVERCGGHLLHYSFNRGLEDWIEKHRKYAVLEGVEARQTLGSALQWRALFDPDPVERRHAVKAFSYRLPLRRTMRLLHGMLVRQVFRDGLAGVHYCWLISRYEGWVAREMKRKSTR
jgi:glycosyltransferase involved in cell wall biosynthesis